MPVFVLFEDYKHYKIYFCSRTHSQIKQAINEFQSCSYGHLRSAVLGSRRHLCINPVAKNAESNLVSTVFFIYLFHFIFICL